MKPSACYDRIVDVMEGLAKFTLLTHDHADYLVERNESAVRLLARVNQSAI